MQETIQPQTSSIEVIDKGAIVIESHQIKTLITNSSPQEKIRENPHETIPISIKSIARSTLTDAMIDSETPPQEILESYDKQEVLNTDLDEPVEVEVVTPDKTTTISDKMNIHKRQQIPNGDDEILPPPGMSESNLEQEIFDELNRNHKSPTISSRKAALFTTEPSSSISPPEEILFRTHTNFSDVKRNSETGEIYREINNTDEIKTSTLNDPRFLNDTESFIFNERYVCSEEPYQVAPEDTNISDDIKVSRHSLGSLERPKSDDAKSIESFKYLGNVSNVTVNSGKPENGSSSLHSLEFSVNDSAAEENHSILSDNSELYTTALNKTVKPERDTSKITISTPDLIKNVTITEAINTLNNDMDQTGSTLNFDIENKTAYTVNSSLTNGTDAVKTNGDSTTGKNHSSLTYITEIQVTPNNGTGNISEIEIVPSLKVDNKQNARNSEHEYENYVKNFQITESLDLKDKNEEFKQTDDISVPNIDPEKELHKIQEIVQEQLKKLPEMRFSTSSYESPSRIPEKRQSQIELLKSNFEKSPPKSSKPEVVIKSRIPISTTMKTPPTSPERRDSRNLDMENQKEILELMSASVHSTPMANSGKYQKSPNKNVTITSIRNSSRIPSGLPVLGGSRPPIPPKKPEQENDMYVHVSTNNSNINSFKQWVFDPVDSVTNISLSGQKPDHK
ncbi:hypothetical protein HHI36_020254 [Cryptolaemus montrouzieri]|uniref:Uncharacterized protein n=1 Tax=Cryptolaemus montrouzieri TaxID=559131 RepID=A0ABD2NAY1_9CUCU